MTLPVSRNTTYTPAAPIKSADLNDIQDCIVGMKFPSTAFPIPASAFVKTIGAATYSDATGLWTGVGVFTFRLPFPPGTQIESVQYAYNRGGAGTLSLRWRSLAIVTGVHTATTISTIVAGTGYTTTTVLAAAITIAGGVPLLVAGAGVSIAMEGDNAANVIGGAIVTASRL